MTVTPKPITPKRAAAQRANAKKPRTLRLTTEFTLAICELIRAGVRPEIAAAMQGVPRRTYFEWMEKARQPGARALLVELMDGVEVALAEWEAGDALLIGQAARKENPGEWQAAAWRLERRLPSVYGKSSKQEIIVQARPFVDVAKLTLEEQKQLHALLSKGRPELDELPKDATPAMLAITAGDRA